MIIMNRYVAFLRGINVSGQKLIKMDVLNGMFVALGFGNVVTYIQSGNVIFDTDETNAAQLRSRIEMHLLKELGYEVITIVRSIDELEAIVSVNPFDITVIGENRKLHVTMFSAAPDRTKEPLLTAVLLEDEEFQIIGNELFMITHSYGNSKLSNTFVEKKLGLSATTRNWATINKVKGL